MPLLEGRANKLRRKSAPGEDRLTAGARAAGGLRSQAALDFRGSNRDGDLPGEGPLGPEATQLCELIHQATRLDPRRKPGPQLAGLVHSIFKLESVAIFDLDLDEIYQAGTPIESLKNVLQSICIFGTVSDDPETGVSRRVLRMGDLSIGALMLRGDTHWPLATSIASLIAISFDRYHAFANESRTESARQAEQLRTTVLDSLAHAYKTPLTVISAASEGLTAIGKLSPGQANMVSLIQEQTTALSHLTTQLLKTAKLHASEMIPFIEKTTVLPLIEDVVTSLSDQLSTVTVELAVSRDDLWVQCDRSLLIALLTQYLDNAAKYSDAGTLITISAVENSSDVVFCVHSYGPVIPPADLELVFDRFYRSSVSENKVPGTGIGLSVAKRSAQAHGGHVWVTSDAAKGTSFYASIPQQGASS